MKEIPLTLGLFALVDDADFNWLSMFKWHAHRCGRNGRKIYAMTQTRTCRRIRMHRLILLRGPFEVDPVIIDHRDHNGLHNWRDNLRIFESNDENMRQCENWKVRAEEPFL